MLIDIYDSKASTTVCFSFLNELTHSMAGEFYDRPGFMMRNEVFHENEASNGFLHKRINYGNVSDLDVASRN